MSYVLSELVYSRIYRAIHSFGIVDTESKAVSLVREIGYIEGVELVNPVVCTPVKMKTRYRKLPVDVTDTVFTIRHHGLTVTNAHLVLRHHFWNVIVFHKDEDDEIDYTRRPMIFPQHRWDIIIIRNGQSVESKTEQFYWLK